jgi:Ca2+-binding RTX toxin-like protein
VTRTRRFFAVRLATTLAAVVAIFVALLIPATASAATREITSAGPLERIIISDTLGCQVFFTGADPGGQYFQGTADDFNCGTVLTTAGVVYTFGTEVNSVPGDGYFDFTGGPPAALFTLVSQSAVTGTGTSADPYRLVTVVDAGATGLRITETTTYVLGADRIRTEIKVENRGGAEQTAILYSFGDCYTGTAVGGLDRDQSSAVGTPGGGAACVQPAGDPNAPFALELFPLSVGSNFGAGNYDNSGDHIENLEPLAGVASPAPPTQQDSYHGLSWNIRVPAGNRVFCSLLTTATAAAGGPQHAETAVAGCLEPPPPCKGSSVTILGTSGNDTFSGTPAPDVIAGLGGNDTLSGLAGNDVICGGEGADNVTGGEGDDQLLGQQGKDKLAGQQGKDNLAGEAGKDTLKGGVGKDTLKGGGGNDKLSGGKGKKDLCNGGGGKKDTGKSCEKEKKIP